MGRLVEVGLALVISLCLVYPIASHAKGKVIGNFPNFIAILENAPCTNKTIVDLIKPEYVKDFKAGVAVDKHNPSNIIPICWADMANDPNGVFIVDITGNTGGLPKSAFKPYVGKESMKSDRFRNPPVNDNPRYRNDGRLWSA